jgi:hypothetical protein
MYTLSSGTSSSHIDVCPEAVFHGCEFVFWTSPALTTGDLDLLLASEGFNPPTRLLKLFEESLKVPPFRLWESDGVVMI